MIWIDLVVKGLISGGLIVLATEFAKRSIIFGAIVISLPLMSILSLIILHREGMETEEIIAYSESILYLVLPSLSFFVVFPQLMKRGWDFWPSLGLAIIATIILYGIGAAMATKFVSGGQA
ncbi:MAG: hypothetical protein CMB31_05140 [Euryarchaeota archaeon]|nr:hypothetical protein [Euryarchaeota archaeon]|tara:strand:- start:3329 stop:3691 length:363 start_codon:yes stop_codon:yes gene_type:complete